MEQKKTTANSWRLTTYQRRSLLDLQTCAGAFVRVTMRSKSLHTSLARERDFNEVVRGDLKFVGCKGLLSRISCPFVVKSGFRFSPLFVCSANTCFVYY